MRDISIIGALSLILSFCGTALAAKTTASFSKYEDEGSEFCSVKFQSGESAGLEIVDYWSEHGPQLLALISKDGAPWMKIVDIDNAKLEVSITFSDGFKLVSSALIDEYSGRPYIGITPDMFFRLLTKPSWTVRINKEAVVVFDGPEVPNLEGQFLSCVNDWK